ncbi:lipoyl(octanoyl) transferase LipB [Candidatus Synchoanobacter obligatus]|uniref:Octanoyltransferase n=1 Tax=Candidatus Synchoanobacter obligatus TaxID=2919597 RepID=A0ABT1L456_9GAMM|nr:lipoyl(octanoyl) transferase LipB [Candidatus Synchoanobacter obligatus]MCP8351947.1 lipoyl(octanoyl) transferase LipB [Candidatus Synchoanobacter obligatus]
MQRTKPNIEHLGRVNYQTLYPRMLEHVKQQKPCAIWVLEHFPVYTQGKRSLPEHILHHNTIPVVSTDRGGQVTYHGPGQMIVYPLLKLDQWHLSPLELVKRLEICTTKALAQFNIKAYHDPDARGVYINQQKIASIGLKIKQGMSYHGIAINLNTNLDAFQAIVPCGNPSLTLTNLCLHTPTFHQFPNVWLKLFLEML